MLQQTPKLLASTRSTGRRRRGAALIEFAIVAPILVLLSVGMIEVTRGIQVKGILSDASRSACRLAILPGATNDTVTAEVNKVLAANGLDGADATVDIEVKGYKGGNSKNLSKAEPYDRIAVTVAMPISKTALLTPLFMKGSTTATLYMMSQR